ncbi:hypothetical protein LJC49_08940 [Ruminococcaceae bacterium OttesenSCG-928-I18]|nr:hypothetical protein [Ruminococcaceae bacterium OttesenSCG-928-I18]
MPAKVVAPAENRMGNNRLEFFLTALLSFCVLMCFMPNPIAAESASYAVEELNAAKGVFQGNITFQEQGVSPRFFMNWIYIFCMNVLSLSWATTTMLLVYFTIAVTAVALANCVFRLCNKHRFLYVLLLTLFYCAGIAVGLAGWNYFHLRMVGLGTSFALALLALSFLVGKSKNWNATWGLLAVSILAHVHEGFWAFCLAALVWVGQTILTRKWPWRQLMLLPVFAVISAARILPTLSFGAASSGITEQEIVEIYAAYRTPHHLMPSTWGVTTIVKFFLLLMYPVVLYSIFLWKNDRGKLKSLLAYAGLFLLGWLGILGAAYLFTEVVPISLVVTMYLPKFFRFVSLGAVLVYMLLVVTYTERQQPLPAALMVAFAFYANVGKTSLVFVLFLLLVLALLAWEKGCTKLTYGAGLIVFAAGFLPIIEQLRKSWMLWLLAASFVILVSFVGKWRGERREAWIKFGAVVALSGILATAGNERLFRYDSAEYTYTVLGPEYFLRAASPNEGYELSKRFKDLTDTDASYFSDPMSGYSLWFQLNSERSCYALFKTTPSNTDNLKEWRERIRKLEGFQDKTPEEMYVLMDDANYDYLLLPIEMQAGYLESGMYEVFAEVEGGSHCVMYRL